ncbi:MAG: DUF47 domain-containing protein [Candidatus Xenobia bacterium]
MGGPASIWRRLFPTPPDFIALLGDQMHKAEEALEALLQWSDHHDQAYADSVFEIEKQADKARLRTVEALTTAFETPLDREDVDDLSRLIDDIVDCARNIIREAIALKVRPDEKIRQMIVNLLNGLKELNAALQSLPKDRKGAAQHAARARHSKRLNERLYIDAMATLLEEDDFRTILRQRETYREMVRLSEVLESCAETLEHAVNKLS